MRIDGGEDLMENSWVQITPLGQEQAGNSLYIQKAFIRQEGGRSFAFVRGEDGTLERRNLITGRDDGYYIEILSGLSMDDFLAFPYGKDVAEGAPTQEGDINTLYNIY